MPSESPDESRAERNGEAKSTTAEGLACNGCRKAKLRCSRDRPNCLHCRKTGLDCIYQSKRVKPGLKSGAVENLHRRLDELERRLEERHTDTKPPIKDASERSDDDSTAKDILALLATELPKLVRRTNKQCIATPASSERSYKRRRQEDTSGVAFRNSDDPSLPEADMLELILTAYFSHIHPWIPMLHKSRFLERLADETQRDQLLVTMHAIVLAACKFVPGADVYSRESTRKWIIGRAMDGLSVENLQALTIMAFNDFGNGNAEKTWSLVGSMTRTVEYAQLAQEQEEGELRTFSQPYAPLPHTADWTEMEERRRVFWNVFLLDRLCSVSTAWNTSLTADDVCRRLPCDGYLWRKQKPVLTPYLGIWDKSKGRIGNPIAITSRHPSPTHGNSGIGFHDITGDHPSNANQAQHPNSDMSTVGAFAYNIEATESMSRIMSYFLQQKVDMRDQHDINSWLTRFKELDLRLVHWKMLLPQKWKANPNLTRQVPLMDPNLTTAHVTHNASMILLHQIIAYPPSHWPFRNRLPSGCSADACYSAGIEISTITHKYLSKSLSGSPVGSQYAFCVFIAARVLLVHWRYQPGNRLPTEFWELVQSLDDMSVRWSALVQPPQVSNLFAKYASRLRNLYECCSIDPDFCIDVTSYTSDIHSNNLRIGSTGDCNTWSTSAQGSSRAMPNDDVFTSSMVPETMDFTSVPQITLDQDFLGLDRVIAFDDGSLFAANFDVATSGWGNDFATL